MKSSEATIGTRIVSNRDFADVPKGTVGVIDEDYGTGVTVAWDLPNRPLPSGYHRWNGKPAISQVVLRDGFDKESDLIFLDLAEK